MEGNFTSGREFIVFAESANPLQPQDKRKCGGDQPQVIEMIVENAWSDARFDDPPIYRIRDT